MRTLTPAPTGPDGVGGLTGFALDVVDRLTEPGIALLVIAETVLPPIPSEVVLPLGGYLAQQGRLDLLWVLLAATAGSLAGSLLLYALGTRYHLVERYTGYLDVALLAALALALGYLVHRRLRKE